MIAMRQRLSVSALTAVVLAGAIVVSPAAPTEQATVHAQDVAADQGVEVAAVEFSDGVPVLTTTMTQTPTRTVTSLEDDPAVVADAVEMYQLTTVADPLRARQWGLDRIDTNGAHIQGATGAGIIVAVLDTGIDAHPDLAGVVVAQADFVPGQGGERRHGTAVAGIIAAQRNGSGIEGVSPGVRLIDARVCGSDGCPSDAITRAVIWSVGQGADVINMSFGGRSPDHTLGAVIDWATAQGVVVVVAAGNSGCSTSQTYCTSTYDPTEWPAAFPTALAVAAVNADDTVPSYSSYGHYVDIAGPTSVLTLVGPYWSSFGGTSASAPHVAGVAALVLDANPALSPTQVQAAIQSSATPTAVTPTHVLRTSELDATPVTNGVAPRMLVGAGVVSASRAVAAAASTTQVALTTTSSSITATWVATPGASRYETSLDAQTPISSAATTVTFDGVRADVEFAVTTTAFASNGTVVARFAPQLTTVASGTAPAAPTLDATQPSAGPQNVQVRFSPAPATYQKMRLVRVGVGPVATSFAVAAGYLSDQITPLPNGAATQSFGYQITDAESAQFQVAYVDNGGRVSDYSAPFTLDAWSNATARRATPNFTVTTLSESSVRLQWAPVPNAPMYRVYDYFRNTAGKVELRYTYTTATSLDIVGLDPGVLKTTRVTVVDTNHVELSFQADGWILPMPERLPAPQVTATGTAASIDLAWPEVNGTTTANVYRSDGYSYGAGGGAGTGTFRDLHVYGEPRYPQVGENYTYRVQLIDFVTGTMAQSGLLSPTVTATLGPYTTPAPACSLVASDIRCTPTAPEAVQVVETRLRNPAGTITQQQTLPVDQLVTYPAEAVGTWTFEVRALEPTFQQRWTPWAATTVTRSTPPVTTPPTTQPPTTQPPTQPPATQPPGTQPPTQPPATPQPGFTAVTPSRVFDTRPGNSGIRPVSSTKVSGGYILEVKATDLPGLVPASGVAAVSLNVTVTGTEGPGFVTVYPCGQLKEVSSLNYAAGATVANAVIAPVSANGTICFHSLAPTHLIVDVNGWFASGSSFTSVTPSRVFDTRPGNSGIRPVASTKVSGGNILQVKVTDLPGLVPASGVAAVSLNVTVTGTEGPGFVTVYPCGQLKEVSSLNYAAGATVANAVIAPVSASGEICLFSLAPTHLIVDVNGWFASGSSFTSVTPSRVFDTRPGNSGIRPVASTKVSGGNILQVKVTDLPGLVPASGVAAVSLNVTVTGTEGPGFVTVYPCGQLKEVSSLNYAAGATVANAVIAPVSASGEICLFSLAPTHLIVDVNGWFGS